MNVIGSLELAGLVPEKVIVRPEPDELAAVGARELQSASSLSGHRRGPVARSHDILRANALRLHEAAELDLDLYGASFGTAKNGTYVPATIDADPAFWRVVGLYIAEGHCSVDGMRHRLVWSFHPTKEDDLVAEVARYWRELGVFATVHRRATSTTVSISSRLLTAWWLKGIGLGANCYEQRIPDIAWGESDESKRALLTGLWLGDGSWSLVNHGPSVVLEYGTVSRELADGILRLLGELGTVARLKIGRTAKSTVDTYWLVISGADQVESMLDLVSGRHREPILASIARRAKRIEPTGYRRCDNAAWVRVTDLVRQPYSGFVYSLEVPPTHTLVTTGGLVVHNCFPKDSLALKQLAANTGYHFQLLDAVIAVNELQKRRVIGKLKQHLGSLSGKRVALLGLAFKPNTDDMREAPSLVLAGRLLAEGAEVRAWDPVAHPDGLHGVVQSPSIEEALAGADAAVLVTEWPQLADVDWAAAGATMRRALLVDGRNMLDPEAIRAAGFTYEGIGRNSLGRGA